MIISLIAAFDKNRAIGKKNRLPWGNFPADMKRFVRLTKGKPVIMGRKTFESIGTPLPGRLNIVLTKNRNYSYPDVKIVHTPTEALRVAGDVPEVVIIGGASIYKQFLMYVRRMYLTLIHEEFEGDTFFPEFNWEEWQEQERSDHGPKGGIFFSYTFLTLERK